MFHALLKALIALLPAGVLFAGSTLLFFKERRVSLLLQMLGAAGAVIVVLTHVCEALGIFPGMAWGQPTSAGHYLDLSSAIAAIAFFPLGYFMAALQSKSRTSH